MAEYSEDMCDPGDIPECQILNLEMSTSETELSSCLHDPHPPNRAVIFMKHSSDQDENANDEAEDSCDEDGLPVIDSEKFNRNYFTMTYTDNEATEEFNNNAAEEVDTSLLLDTSLSGDEEDEEDEEDKEEEEDDEEEEEEAAEEYSSSRGDHDTPQHRRLRGSLVME